MRGPSKLASSHASWFGFSSFSVQAGHGTVLGVVKASSVLCAGNRNRLFGFLCL